MKAKIIIVMDGGLVQEVIANGQMEVLTLDQDIEGGAQEHIRTIALGNSPPTKCYVQFEEVTVDAPLVAKAWKAA